MHGAVGIDPSPAVHGWQHADEEVPVRIGIRPQVPVGGSFFVEAVPQGPDGTVRTPAVGPDHIEPRPGGARRAGHWLPGDADPPAQPLDTTRSGAADSDPVLLGAEQDFRPAPRATS